MSRRVGSVLVIFAIVALLATQPARATTQGMAIPKRCQILNAAADLTVLPPTLLLEGQLCKEGREPSVWISKDGTPTPVAVLGSGDTSVLVDVTGFEFVQDARAWVVCGNGAPASGCVMDVRINSDDADADPTNELQGLSKSGSTISLSQGGGSVSLNDDDPNNELQGLSKSGSTISLSQGGDSVSLNDDDPVNEIQEIERVGVEVCLRDPHGGCANIQDADANPSNELNTGVALSGNSLTVTDAGGTLSADLSGVLCEVTNDGSGTVFVDCGSGGSASLPVPLCGNGVVERGEDCDDGNLVGGDTCPSDCTGPVNEIFRLRFCTATGTFCNGFPTGGTFTLSWETRVDGILVTAASDPIPYDATSRDLQMALEQSGSIGIGNVKVTKASRSTSGDVFAEWLIEFTGELGNTNLEQPTVGLGGLTINGGSPFGSTTVIQNGANAP